MADTLRALGLPLTGGNYRMISARVRQAGLDISHFRTATIRARCTAISKQTLERLVPVCTSVAQILVKLQLPIEGRSHRELTLHLRQLGIDTRHFRGRGWSRGETNNTHPRWHARRFARRGRTQMSSSKTHRYLMAEPY